MKILIDGDACSKITLTEKIARQKRIPCHIYCDASRDIYSEYSEVHTVDIGFNSADMALIKHCSKGDVVITNDISLAAMALAKNAYVVNNYGMEFTDSNITQMLMRKHIYAKSKNSSVRNKQRKQGKELFQQTRHPSFAQTLSAVLKKTQKGAVNE